MAGTLSEDRQAPLAQSDRTLGETLRGRGIEARREPASGASIHRSRRPELNSVMGTQPKNLSGGRWAKQHVAAILPDHTPPGSPEAGLSILRIAR